MVTVRRHVTKWKELVTESKAHKLVVQRLFLKDMMTATRLVMTEWHENASQGDGDDHQTRHDSVESSSEGATKQDRVAEEKASEGHDANDALACVPFRRAATSVWVC